MPSKNRTKKRRGGTPLWKKISFRKNKVAPFGPDSKTRKNSQVAPSGPDSNTRKKNQLPLLVRSQSADVFRPRPRPRFSNSSNPLTLADLEDNDYKQPLHYPNLHDMLRKAINENPIDIPKIRGLLLQGDEYDNKALILEIERKINKYRVYKRNKVADLSKVNGLLEAKRLLEEAPFVHPSGKSRGPINLPTP
jgi:hypothetical protein